MNIPRRPEVLGVLLFASMGLAACEDTNTLDLNLVTTVQLQDYFSFDVNGLDNVSDAARYFWVTTGQAVVVDVTPSITKGTAILQLRDTNGTVKYRENIADGVDTTTTSGIAGIWQVDIVLTEVTGGFSFTLERDTVSTP
jgi:hypothetical protein